MKAVRLHGRGGPDHLVYEDAPQPHPGLGEVLVRVYATGIIANELKWDVTYQTKAGSPRALPIPGRDLSGVVEEVGYGVTTLVPGSEVYAMLDYCYDGAEAEYTIALPSELAPKPGTLDHVQASTAQQEVWESLPSNWPGMAVRMLSRTLQRAIATSCSSWEPLRSSTIPPRASRMWFRVSTSSSIWWVATPCSAPGKW